MMMYEEKIYEYIAERLESRHPKVIESLNVCVNENILTVRHIMVYLRHCIKMWDGVDYIPTEKTLILTQEVTRKLYRLVAVEEQFTLLEWYGCLDAMIKLLMDLDEEANKLLKKKTGRKNSLKKLEQHLLTAGTDSIDGKRLSGNERKFYEWCAERFNEEEWLKKNKLKW